MSVREKYDILFMRKIVNGKIFNHCSAKVPGGSNSVLFFLTRFDKKDASDLLEELVIRINLGYNTNDSYESDLVEHMDIIFQYPNIDIDGVLLMPMQDMKGLLEEWISFITD